MEDAIHAAGELRGTLMRAGAVRRVTVRADHLRAVLGRLADLEVFRAECLAAGASYDCHQGPGRTRPATEEVRPMAQQNQGMSGGGGDATQGYDATFRQLQEEISLLRPFVQPAGTSHLDKIQGYLGQLKGSWNAAPATAGGTTT